MWCEFAQKRDEITVTVPFDLEAHVFHTPHTSFGEKRPSSQVILYFLKLRMVHQKELDHAGVLGAESMLVRRVEVI